MKTNPTIFSKLAKRTTLVAAVFGIAVAFTACKNEVIEPEAIGMLAVTNASPSSVDFLIDSKQVNNGALTFGSKTIYFRTFPGSRTGEVRFTGTTADAFSKKFEITEGYYHSLYIISQKNATTQKDTLSYVFLRDEFTQTETGKAKVRFMNLSSDSPALDLVFETDTTAFNDIAFKGRTPFKNIVAKKYTLTLKNRITGTPVATLADVQIDQNRFYTVWAKGLSTTTVDAQKLAIKVDMH